MAENFNEILETLSGLDYSGMYNSDFLHTWDKTTDELKALYETAAAIRNLRERNISSRIFDSGLAVSLFRTTHPYPLLLLQGLKPTWSRAPGSGRRSPRSPMARPFARPLP